MRISIRSANPKVLLIYSILLCIMITGCVKEYPPFDEYQVVGFAPVDSVRYGRLFLASHRLYVLYDTSYYNRWNLMREYDISNPLTPQLISFEELTMPLRAYYLNSQDTLVFFQSYYSGLIIFNLSTRESHFLDLDPGIYDIAYAQSYLFINGYAGFRVLDISSLPNYVEVFNDSVAHYGGFIELRDTILLEVYRDNSYRYKFWNVANPTQPQIILEGELPNQPNDIDYVGLTEQYVICLDYAALYVYRYDLNDSLVYEEAMYLDYNPDNQAVTDSLIYLADYEHIEIIRIDDFTAQQIGIGEGYYSNEGILSMGILGERIYVLIRNTGLHVYERRLP
jgi:hypothetical protein